MYSAKSGSQVYVEVSRSVSSKQLSRESSCMEQLWSSTWTITSKIQKYLDGCFTKMLRAALNVNWKDKTTNQELYGDLPLLSQKKTTRAETTISWALSQKSRGNSTIPCFMHTPTWTKKKPGRPPTTYVDVLGKDTDLTTQELQNYPEGQKSLETHHRSPTEVYLVSE